VRWPGIRRRAVGNELGMKCGEKGEAKEPLQIMKYHYKNRDAAAREWKKSGGRVAGYFCIDVPEELILAAGFFPFRLSGDPGTETDEADKYAMPVYEGFVRSMLQMLLTDRYDFLDFLIVPHARDSIEYLHSILGTIKQIEQSRRIPELYLFDTLHTKLYLSAAYFSERLRELKERLEAWSGNKISNESISEAVKLCNENRALLRKVATLRAADPPRISGREALEIIGSSMFMLKAEHNRLLAQFLEEADRFPTRNGSRLFVEASPLDNLQLYGILEGCGATIVGEDNCWGDRYFDTLVDESLEPLEAITKRYLLKAPCPRMYPIESRVNYCKKQALETKADGVVFSILEYDNSQTWEYPDEEKALHQAGIPTLCFKKQKYLILEEERENIEVQLQQFIKGLLQSKPQHEKEHKGYEI
jgi:benzoyl-CoA reductase/2-hydroxyglutaryl-CoA dehydratase subunit BcrC/BadD/HgdB